MVLAYLQSVLLCRDFGLLRHDGHFPRRSSHFWCQAASHLDGRWDLVNVLRIVLRRGGKRCCRVLHRKNGCSNRREYMALAGTFLNEKPFENCLFFWPLPSLVCLRQTFLAWAFYKVFESDVWERLEERRNKVRQEKIVLRKATTWPCFSVCLLIDIRAHGKQNNLPKLHFGQNPISTSKWDWKSQCLKNIENF